MRYLNKIIFINSASVNYAEIELSGNIHFTGNQGSGKSTLLRAILFFYNANKLKLGIGREKKRFDEYYFEYQNSYIIYEVKRDQNYYCVLAYKVNGKVAFRFIDSEYKKELFISPDGRAYESWEKIRTILGRHIHYSKIINNYEEYRQIIYGDNKGLRPEFRKYSIIESRQYQNIPRTIQNVFLNSKLEAQFIKETIINSISDDVFSIDLENYAKNHLRDFESQINDVKIWSQKNQKGQINIRNLAEKAIENYRIYKYLGQEKKQLAGQLFSRMQSIEQEKPPLIKNYEEEKGKLDELKKRLDNLESLFRKREQDIVSNIKVLKNKIDEANIKRAEYEAKNIFDIINKAEKEDELLSQSKNLEEEKSILESKYTEISEKYESLIKQQKNSLEKFYNDKDKELNKYREVSTNNKLKISEKYDKQIDSLKNEFEKQTEDIIDQISEVLKDENQHKQKRAELKHKIFFQTEIEDRENEVNSLTNQISELEILNQKLHNEIKNIRREWELKETEIIRKFINDIAKKNNEIENLKESIIDNEQKIKQSKSSFYSWLNENVKGWENTIGKVINEDILYKQDIDPVLKDSLNKWLYGVEINLDILNRKVKTVSELNAEIENIRSKIQEIQKEINQLENAKARELENLKKNYKGKINKQNDSISENEYNLNQKERKLKDLSSDLTELKERSETEKANKLKEIENELEKIAVKKNELEQKKREINNLKQRKINHLINEKKRELGKLQESLSIKEEQIRKEKEERHHEINIRIEEIKNRQFSEMKDEGADIQRIKDIEEQLRTIREKLDFIEKNKALIIEYHKDKRELFDKVPEYRIQIKEQQQKRDELAVKNKKEKEKLLEKHNRQKQSIEKIENRIKEFEEDLEKFSQFEKSEVFQSIEQYYAPSGKNEDKLEKAVVIIENLKEKHYKIIDILTEIRRTVNIFVGNFSENNIFKFKTFFNSDSEYLDFVSDLKEFIEEDKISEYEKRVNERFANIISLIARETGELMSKEAEIEKIIKKINNDFLNKNFVEAIKEMELRTSESSNPIVNILIKIKEFHDEFGLNIGQSNLFTDTGANDQNRKAVDLLKQLTLELERHKSPVLKLSDSFDLQFRIVENDNNTGWVENLTNVGSEGTDILVKAMINILLLNVLKESASRKFRDFKLHCMMDEIGRLHPLNVQGILRFANERNILLINGSPISQNAMDYRYTYKLSKEKSLTENKYITHVKKLVKIQQ